MTQPRIETIELTRDADFAAELTFDQPVATFAAMRFTIREDWASSETDNDSAAFTAELTPTGTYTAELAVPRAAARALTGKRYVHDVKVTMLASGNTYQTQLGPVFVGPDVGRG